MRITFIALAFAVAASLAAPARAADICHNWNGTVTWMDRDPVCDATPSACGSIATSVFECFGLGPFQYPGQTLHWEDSLHGCGIAGSFEVYAGSSTAGYIAPVGPVGGGSCTATPPPQSCATTSCEGSMFALLFRGDQAPELQGPSCNANGGGSPSAAAASSSVPLPVSVLNGNMWFVHTDITIPGLGTGLDFTRTYNSLAAKQGFGGIFGAGWTHSYESKITVFPPAVLKVTEPSGTPVYLHDADGDSVYQPRLPFVQASSIVKAGTTYTRTFRSGDVEVYDQATGALLSLTDASGNTTQLVRDPSGKLLSITEPSGRSVTLAYDASGKVTSLTGPAGIVASYSYDTSARLTSVHYPDGSGYTYSHGGSWNQVVSVTDAAGRVLEIHAYDSAGRAITSELADGREKVTLSYSGTQTTVTDALGNVTVYNWKTLFGNTPRITKITGPCVGCGGSGGTVQEWTYDDQGRVLTHKDALNHTTTYTYDTASNLLTTTNALNQTTTYTYDAQGRVLTATGPDLAITTTTTYAAAGPLTITDPLNHVTSLTYNGQGKLSAVTDPRNKTTSIGYTAAGDLQTVTDPLNHTTTFGYDSLGRRTTVTDALNHTTTTTYDPRGRITRVTSHDGTHTDLTYDLSGRRVNVRDPMNRTTYSVYDAYGRLTQVVDAANGVTAYGYDLMGNLSSLTDAKNQATTFTYDAYNRVSAVTYPGAASETYTYDTAGRLATRTDRKGVVTTYAYDALGRLTGKTYSDGTTPPVSYTYDTAGRLATAANGTDTLGWSYDLAGQLLSETSTKNASTVAYTYDNGGNRLTLSLDGTLFVSYAYDDASRLSSITRGSNVFGFGYDAANRRTAMTFPNGVNTAYTYDDLNRVVRIKADYGAAPITDFQYTYDAAGNRIRKQQLDYTEDYAYDALYRLVGVERSAGLTGSWRYGYDSVGNPITEQHDGNVLSGTFNEKNQLLSRTVGGTMRWRGSLNEAGNVSFTSATVNGLPARMLAGNVFEADMPTTAGTNTVTVQAKDVSGNVTTKNYQVDVGGTGASYGYDANGNLTQTIENGVTWTYEWNAGNELKRVTKDSAEIVRLGYDPRARRVEKVAGGVINTYTYDDVDILRQNAPSTLVRHVRSPEVDELLMAEDGAGQLTYEHLDALGSELKHTDANGTVTLTRSYNAFGQLLSGDTFSGTAFTGRDWDAETQLQYLRARYYDPKAARFISEDPITFAGGSDFYSYVANNPAVLVDPSGFMPGYTNKQMAGVQREQADYLVLSCQFLFFTSTLSTAFGGHSFAGGGVGFPKGCGCYLALGSMNGPSRPRDVDTFLNGVSTNASAYFVFGGGKTRSAGGIIGTERGIGLGIGVGAQRGQPDPLHCIKDSCYDKNGRVKR